MIIKSSIIYISEHNENRRNIDIILYKNHYIILKKFHVLIGKQNRRYVCRKCLNSYTNQLEILTHKRLCGNNDKSVYIPCKETHVKWDKQYQNVPLYSINFADFEARNEPIFDPDKDQCKTIDICKQVPCNGFYTINK